MPGIWAPSVFSKSDTATYLFKASIFSSAPPLPFFNSAGTGLASALAEGHFSPKTVPLVRNSWARYPAKSLLCEAGSRDFGEAVTVAAWGVMNLGILGISWASKPSLSFRLFDAPSVENRRGGGFSFVLIAHWPYATSEIAKNWRKKGLEVETGGAGNWLVERRSGIGWQRWGLGDRNLPRTAV